MKLDQTDITQAYPTLTITKALPPSGQKQVFMCTDGNGEKFVAKFVQLDYRFYNNVFMRRVDVEERTNRELALMSRYTSPYLPSLAAGFEPKRFKKGSVEFHGFVENYAGQKSVRDKLDQASRLNEDEVKRIMIDVAEALKIYADDSIVHRDLKPENVIFNDATDNYVLIDAGVHLDPANATISNVPVGTPIYFSPEQAAGTRRDLDSRSDIYALGIMAYEASSGFHPFIHGATSSADVESAVLSAKLPASIDLGTTCPGLDSCILKMLQRYPYLRHTNPDVLLLELRGEE